MIRVLERSLARPRMRPDDVDLDRIRSVLVLRPHDQLGDFLLSTPVLAALRARFPAARHGVLVLDRFADAVRDNPNVDEVLVLRKGRGRWNPGHLAGLKKQLVGRWDLAVVLTTVSHSLTSDLLALLSRAPLILGSTHGVWPGCSRNFMYDLEADHHSGPRHQTDRNLDIVRHIGADVDDRSELLRLTESERRAGAEAIQRLGLAGHRPVIALHVGAGKPANRWPAERFAELARLLHDRLHARIVLCWGPDEAELAESFQRHTAVQPTLFPPTRLRELAALFSQCDLLVCNDTGVMHLCAAVGTPLVAIFGPTDPLEWKPLGSSFVALRGQDRTTRPVSAESVFTAVAAVLRSGRTTC